ncbi:hypothetical protein [Paenibacillus sp. FSL K6-1230]|uniref:hypothetical protein n=1 Tax=Paenibacillus sp. FSL K6-1230 TaxID=2921603 RepID=UPI0003A7B567
MLRTTKILWGALIGYVVAAISSPLMPEFVSWAIPALATLVGSMIPSSTRAPLTESRDVNQRSESRLRQEQAGMDMRPPRAGSSSDLDGSYRSGESSIGDQQQNQQQQSQQSPEMSRPDALTEQDPVFGPVIAYLEVLEDMVISEGRKNELDNEIVEKSLSLFARLQRVIPDLHALNNGDVNHTVRRLILKDLNSLINPFLRLSGDAKRTNRRTLLNGLRDVDAKITEIVSTIEHKDLIELQSKAELIHQRYNSSEL